MRRGRAVPHDRRVKNDIRDATPPPIVRPPSPDAHGSERPMSDRVRVGLFADALEPTDGDPERLRAALGQVAHAAVDHVCVGDHVSFFVGAGSDGVSTATSLLAVQASLPVYVRAYLLPLRH